MSYAYFLLDGGGKWCYTVPVEIQKGWAFAMQTASLYNFIFTYYYYFPCHKEIK